LNTYSFIVNPKAGRGRGEKILRRLGNAVSAAQIESEILCTEGPGHATALAQECSPGSIVVAVGGDGTVNEVANGLVASTKILGILPCGSGNDLVKSIAIPSDFDLAFKKLLARKTKRIDCATVACYGEKNSSSNSTKRFFVNGVGVGFDAAVAERTKHIKRLSGKGLYFIAVFQTMGRYVSPLYRIETDSYSGDSKNLLIALGNGRCAGGGFFLTPHAKVDDGWLDVCMIDDISILQILRIMPKVIRGTHVRDQRVRMLRCKSFNVAASDDFFVHADGELVGLGVNRVEVRIVEQGLHAIVG
jgi:diacylglycerol kinase (ATP)